MSLPRASIGTGDVMETARVRLRLLDERDESLYRRIYTDPVLMALVGEPMDAAQAGNAFLRTCRLNREDALHFRSWVVSMKPEDEIAGLLGIRRAGDVVEIGGMILPEWQGKGVSGHAFPLGIAVAFSFPGVARMMIRYRPENVFAEGLMYKLGFTRVSDRHPEDGMVRLYLERESWRSHNP